MRRLEEDDPSGFLRRLGGAMSEREKSGVGAARAGGRMGPKRWRTKLFAVLTCFLTASLGTACQQTGTPTEKQPSSAERLFAATGEGRIQDVASLLDKDRTLVNSRNEHDVTPLHVAANVGSVELCKLLIGHGADVNAVTTRGLVTGVTPLYNAAARGNAGACQFLLENGARVGMADSDGKTPLMRAAFEGQVRAAEVLLNAGADANGRDRHGLTALDSAVGVGQVQMVDILLKHGARVDSANSAGHTALHFVAYPINGVEICRRLLEMHPRLDAQDEMGRTPLHRAAEVNNADVVTVLLEAGANPKILDHDGETAFQLAQRRGAKEAMATLKH